MEDVYTIITLVLLQTVKTQTLRLLGQDGNGQERK